MLSSYHLLLSVASSYALWKIIGKALRRHFISKLTILQELHTLGEGRQGTKKLSGTAVVCGGSIAGLWAARICSDHFENVIIVEPETWLSDAEEKSSTPEVRTVDGYRTKVNKRTRVFQYHAIHAYKPLLLIALRKVFPSWDAEASVAGILFRPADFGSSVSGLPTPAPYYLYPKGDMPQLMLSTRPTYENLLRKLVKESCPNVQFVLGTVTGIVPGQNNRIEAVKIRMGGVPEVKVQHAELVVDCTGPTQAGLKWLSRAGSGVPQPHYKPKAGHLSISELRVEYEENMRYVCFDYFVPEDLRSKLPIPGGYDKAGWLFVVLPTPEKDNKSMLGTRYENHRIQYSFAGWGDVPMPREHADMAEFMEGLVFEPGHSLPQWIPETLAMLANNHETEPYRHVFPVPPSSFVRYHQAINLPCNFVAIGDSMMTVNPVFGHGCMKACIGAVTLNSFLAKTNNRISDDFASKFFTLYASRTNGMWEQTKGQDYRFPTTVPIQGEEEIMEKALQTGGGFMSHYIRHATRLASKDRAVGEALWFAQMLLGPATDVFHPSVAVKVACDWLKG